MRKTRFIVLLLVAALLFSGCESLMNLAASNVMGEEYDRMSMPFSQMTYVRPDMAALEQALDKACAIAQTDATAAQIMNKVYKYYDLYNEFGTMYRLAELRYSMDLTDEFYREEYEFCSGQLSYADSLLEKLYVALAQSSAVETLEARYFTSDFFAPYQPPEGSDDDWEYDTIWDETYMELTNQENEIINRYYAAQDVLSDLDPEHPAYLEQCLAKLGPIYIELIRVRQEIARHSGYDSYEDFINQWYYNRQVSSSSIESYTEMIQEHLVPLYRQYCTPEHWDWAENNTATEEDCLLYMQSAALNMGDVVAEAYGQMRKRELYDLTPSNNKAAGSYETYLTTFSAPFILVSPAQDMSDLLTFSHEFGHFANDYAVQGTYTSTDVSEVLSQAMEYLSLCYADSLNTQDMAQLQRLSMTNALETYVAQMAFYTFEQEVYRLPEEELSTQKLTDCFSQVIGDFCLESADILPEEWVTIPHFFQAPFYVFSYVVSCDAAMQIYQEELSSTGAGLETYIDFLQQWEDLPLRTYLIRYGLTDPIDPERIESVADTFRTILGDQAK